MNQSTKQVGRTHVPWPAASNMKECVISTYVEQFLKISCWQEKMSWIDRWTGQKPICPLNLTKVGGIKKLISILNTSVQVKGKRNGCSLGLL